MDQNHQVTRKRNRRNQSYETARKPPNGNTKFMPAITLNVNELNIPVKEHEELNKTETTDSAIY